MKTEALCQNTSICYLSPQIQSQGKVLDFTGDDCENYCLWFPLMSSTLFRKDVFSHIKLTPRSPETHFHISTMMIMKASMNTLFPVLWKNLRDMMLEAPPWKKQKFYGTKGWKFLFSCLSQMLTIVAQEHTKLSHCSFQVLFPFYLLHSHFAYSDCQEYRKHVQKLFKFH